MVVDRSGSLGGIRRHDFSPFGEELSAGIGIRSASLGYGADSTRQKFTGKERDDETGLDYFLARYYSNTQGRFTSVDPENAGAVPDLPQTWNGYSYAINNPIVNTDPDGLKVRICGTDGACTDADTDLSDADFNKYFRDAKDITLKNGNIFQNGELIGSFQRQSFDDLSDQANAFIFGRGGMVDQSRRAKPIIEAVGIAAAGQIAAPFIGLTNAAISTTGLIADGGKPGPGLLMSLPIPGGAIANALAKFGLAARAGRGAGVIEVVGDVRKARAVFDELRGANAANVMANGAEVANSATGAGKVTFRAASKSGPPTVDVHGVEQGLRKIKFVPQ
jgi:RHS repeat-associated protein